MLTTFVLVYEASTYYEVRKLFVFHFIDSANVLFICNASTC